jgi:hypothetical protein
MESDWLEVIEEHLPYEIEMLSSTHLPYSVAT